MLRRGILRDNHDRYGKVGSCVDAIYNLADDNLVDGDAQVENQEADKITDADKHEGVFSSDVLHEDWEDEGPG